MTVEIHKTAIVDPKAQIGKGVKIGPYSVVGPDVQLGDNVNLIGHVNLAGAFKYVFERMDIEYLIINYQYLFLLFWVTRRHYLLILFHFFLCLGGVSLDLNIRQGLFHS